LQVLDQVSLEVATGEMVTLFGPNGCGKSTLLRVLAGVEPFDSGAVGINGKGADEADTGLVFQNYSQSLYPWLTAEENMLFAFSLKKRKDQRVRARERLDDFMGRLGFRAMLPLEHYPYQLSGGQQQLVAILRTLLYDPQLILMDEPFSSLDFQTRALMQSTLQTIWRETGTTILFVSHDIEEAILLGDRLVLLSPLPARILEVISLTSAGPLADGTTINPAVFARPRGPDLLEAEDFFRVKRHCLRLMREHAGS
jgi:NitT/TauT family transport system ATP-binding protein